MPNRSGPYFLQTREEIVHAATTWANFRGFTAITCQQCEKTANIPARRSAGWICVCGTDNTLSHKNQVPYENPDLGPTRATIDDALAEVSGRY